MIIWTLQIEGENWAAGGMEPSFTIEQECVDTALELLRIRKDVRRVICIKNEVEGATYTHVGSITFGRGGGGGSGRR